MERAVDWIFSHMEELDQPQQSMDTEPAPGGGGGDTQRGRFRDGPGSECLLSVRLWHIDVADVA